MRIKVISKECTKTFAAATGWVVDVGSHLHITKTGDGNVASFHADEWLSVEREDAA